MVRAAVSKVIASPVAIPLLRRFTAVEVLDGSGSVLATTTFTDTHFRFGQISWRRVSGNQVEFTVLTAWRTTFAPILSR